jgi:transcriptional regulator with XRE-family HTH domain
VRRKTSVTEMVRRRRIELGLSQADAAKQAGISRRTWSEIELGHRSGSKETLDAMTAVLQLPDSALEVSVVPLSADAELVALRRQVIEMVGTLTLEEAKQLRISLLRMQVENLQERLASYERARS